MIRMVIEMSDDVYENFKNGIRFGLFSVSIDDLKTYGVTVKDIIYCEDAKE